MTKKSAQVVKFFACDAEKIRQNVQQQVEQQHSCDEWIKDWPDVDHDWLFGTDYYSPLALSYYQSRKNVVEDAINDRVQQAITDCEKRRYAQTSTKEGMRIALATRINGGGVVRGRGADATGIQAMLSVSFTSKPDQQHDPNDPAPCPPIPLELFSDPVDFHYTMYGPGSGNIRWELTDSESLEEVPWFDLYGRRMTFYNPIGRQTIGRVRLIFNKIADLWVNFQQRPIPAAIAGRVDRNQRLLYRVSKTPGGGNFNFSVVLEFTHLETGQIWYDNHFMEGSNRWRSEWSSMSMDANGVIRHYNFQATSDYLNDLMPIEMGLPMYGTYRMRCILMGYVYQTGDCSVNTTLMGGADGMPMSSKRIFVSHQNRLFAYTPGQTTGLIPALEVTYTRSRPLADAILMDWVYDFHNGIMFRHIVRLENTATHPVGVVVAIEQERTDFEVVFWAKLNPGEVRFLAGSVHAFYPCDNRFISACSIAFENALRIQLYFTAPDNPTVRGGGVTELKYIKSIHYIMIYDEKGEYGYKGDLINNNVLSEITTENLVGQRQTFNLRSFFDLNSYEYYEYGFFEGIHRRFRRPWLTGDEDEYFSRLEVSYEEFLSGRWQYEPNGIITLPLYIVPQVTDALGLTDSVVVDSNDCMWEEDSKTTVLVTRFYRPDGVMIDEEAMRNAFQSAITTNEEQISSSYYEGKIRNIIIKPSVRFGFFMFVGGAIPENINDSLTEVGGFSALSSLGTRFIYKFRREL